jgi:hypothetical protein
VGVPAAGELARFRGDLAQDLHEPRVFARTDHPGEIAIVLLRALGQPLQQLSPAGVSVS